MRQPRLIIAMSQRGGKKTIPVADPAYNIAWNPNPRAGLCVSIAFVGLISPAGYHTMPKIKLPSPYSGTNDAAEKDISGKKRMRVSLVLEFVPVSAQPVRRGSIEPPVGRFVSYPFL